MLQYIVDFDPWDENSIGLSAISDVNTTKTERKAMNRFARLSFTEYLLLARNFVMQKWWMWGSFTFVVFAYYSGPEMMAKNLIVALMILMLKVTFVIMGLREAQKAARENEAHDKFTHNVGSGTDAVPAKLRKERGENFPFSPHDRPQHNPSFTTKNTKYLN